MVAVLLIVVAEKRCATTSLTAMEAPILKAAQYTLLFPSLSTTVAVIEVFGAAEEVLAVSWDTPDAGRRLGAAVGAVGMTVGLAVGERLGAVLGAVVCPTVGNALGVTLGFAVGAILGLVV